MRYEGAITPRTKPTGQIIGYPECGQWDCDDDYDWSTMGPDDPEYPSVKREHKIVYYHEPRDEWQQRLREERDRRNGGEPLWMTS